MILCFSGTGNSRYIAKKIAAELQDEIINVNAKIKTVDYSPIKTGENVIVVTPTYAWRIPRIVSDWLSKTKLLSAKRIWFVMNCGSEIGNASKYNRSLAEQKHLCYMGKSMYSLYGMYLLLPHRSNKVWQKEHRKTALSF
nr:EFR1 family ferrodoxin [uncultured Eubacterium sp.]